MHGDHDVTEASSNAMNRGSAALKKLRVERRQRRKMLAEYKAECIPGCAAPEPLLQWRTDYQAPRPAFVELTRQGENKETMT
jgi:hypothetical protein